MQKKDYQDQGFIPTSETRSLKEALGKANRKTAMARRDTPIELHNKYSSLVRFSKDPLGYEWGWQLKGV